MRAGTVTGLRRRFAETDAERDFKKRDSIDLRLARVAGAPGFSIFRLDKAKIQDRKGAGAPLFYRRRLRGREKWLLALGNDPCSSENGKVRMP